MPIIRSRNTGLDFMMKIIGSGGMKEELSRMINTYGLGGSIELTGAVPTEQVRAEDGESFGASP